MYVFVDSSNRITAFNENDMTGNAGWHEVPEILTEPIFVEECAALYKYVDGHAVPRTQQEIDADIPHSQPEPEEPTELELLRQQVEAQQTQLDEQADALIELAELIVGGE
jgi:hypothetical protein